MFDLNRFIKFESSESVFKCGDVVTFAKLEAYIECTFEIWIHPFFEIIFLSMHSVQITTGI